MPAMVEYGGAVRQSVGAGGGSVDRGGDLMDFFTGLVDRVTALPPEYLLIIAAVIVVGGFMMSRRRVF
jgi:hypothetical protein